MQPPSSGTPMAAPRPTHRSEISRPLWTPSTAGESWVASLALTVSIASPVDSRTSVPPSKSRSMARIRPLTTTERSRNMRSAAAGSRMYAIQRSEAVTDVAFASRDASNARGVACVAAVGTELSATRPFGKNVVLIAIANIAAINATDDARSNLRRLQRWRCPQRRQRMLERDTSLPHFAHRLWVTPLESDAYREALRFSTMREPHRQPASDS